MFKFLSEGLPFRRNKDNKEQVKKEWAKRKGEVFLAYIRLKEEEKDIFRKKGLCYCNKREHYYLNPEIGDGIKKKLRVFVNETNTISVSDYHLLHEILNGEIEVTYRNHDEFRLPT